MVRRAAPDAPLAFAALEMAVADAHLRAEGRSLADMLGVSGRTVAVGAVLGRAATVEGLVADVAGLVDSGISRVKLKIGPGWDLVPVEAVRDAFPELLVQVDANGSYREEDADHLAGLDRFGLLCIEQPLDRARPGRPRPTGRPPGHPDLPGREPGLTPDHPPRRWPPAPARWCA